MHFCVLQSPGPSGKVLTRHPGLINPVLPHICIPDRLDSLAQRIHIWIIDLEKGETMGGFYMAYLESMFTHYYRIHDPEGELHPRIFCSVTMACRFWFQELDIGLPLHLTLSLIYSYSSM